MSRLLIPSFYVKVVSQIVKSCYVKAVFHRLQRASMSRLCVPDCKELLCKGDVSQLVKSCYIKAMLQIVKSCYVSLCVADVKSCYVKAFCPRL